MTNKSADLELAPDLIAGFRNEIIEECAAMVAGFKYKGRRPGKAQIVDAIRALKK